MHVVLTTSVQNNQKAIALDSTEISSVGHVASPHVSVPAVVDH